MTTIPDFLRPQSYSLLLVEDNAIDAAAAKAVFRRQEGGCYEVTHVKLLSAALSALDAHPFDIVLLDLGLPDSSGLETLFAIRKAAPTIPVVVLTAYEEDECGAAAVREGAQDYLPKSEFSMSSIRRAVRYAIERAHHQRELDRSRRELLGLIAHETNGPSSMLIRGLELLRDSSREWTAYQEELLRRLLHAAERLQRHAERALMIGALDNLSPTHFSTVDVGGLIQQAVLDLSDSAAERNVSIRTSCDAAAVLGDAKALRSAFSFLLENAIEVSADSAEVEIRAAISETWCDISITDYGPGIAPDVLSHLLELCTVSSLIHHHEGLGISIALSREIVTRHGGRFYAQSVLGQGSTFTIRLPLLEPKHDADAQAFTDASLFIPG
ncbi:MAG: hybrid sensor histidine kinase/response regulator [Bdellovibrionales bacterium]|nr:hybrid sensor histidine kinase/response regulator [Bdellovibrionales bacterium]